MKLIFERTYNFEQITQIAKEIKDIVLTNKKIMFKGEVGAGKTTFIKALAAQFGVLGQVDSPTFSLVNEYIGQIEIYHFDLYRLKNYAELIDIGWQEYVDSQHHLWVEWPENAPEAFSEAFLLLKLTRNEAEDQRHLAIYVF